MAVKEGVTPHEAYNIKNHFVDAGGTLELM
jgi:ribosomal protein L7/L12